MDKIPSSIFFSVILLIAFAGILPWRPENVSCGVQASSLPSNMPVVFVDPLNAIASVGETFTISVKIFNLTNNAYSAASTWYPREDLPPPGTWANYSLGNLFGLDVFFSWDPEVLEYVSHQKKIPVEDYPDGLLHEDTLEILNEVGITEGTYWVAESSISPALPFNKPDENATVFDMTFLVKKQGRSPLTFEEVQLAVPWNLPGYENFRAECPHWVIDGSFETPNLATRLDTLEVGTLIEGRIHEPVIYGEDATVRVNVTNDAAVADMFNLSIAMDAIQLHAWEDIAIEAGERMTLNHSIIAGDLAIGLHQVTATVSSDLLKATGIDFDNATVSLRVVRTPDLSIQGPTRVPAGSYPTYDASGSVHNDPSGEIWNYTWMLFGPGEPVPRDVATGGQELVTYTFHILDLWPDGDWTIVLLVKDNFGVEYLEERAASAPYREMKILTVGPMHLNITEISQTPHGETVLPNTHVRIDATVEAYLDEVQFVTLAYLYINSSGSFMESLNMTNLSGNEWVGIIPPYPQGTEIIYTITAEDNLGNRITTEELGYQLGYDVIPEFRSLKILLTLILATLAVVLVYRKKDVKVSKSTN